MAKNYDHGAIERKWQEQWAQEKLFETPDSAPGKENFYSLVEFPYPSGDLHVGHWYAYAVPDAFVRMKRMQGKNVLFPFGFDAFGLPAENAAIKRKMNPADWIEESVLKMRAKIKTMGSSFDWAREVVTSSPEYMKWTQWLFLQFYRKGLAYRGKGRVNWCPVDQTVLANEQVVDGKCERCGSAVEQKELEQWFFKITEYADRLLADLDPLDWPEPIKESQRNWIGRSEGAEIDFELEFEDPKLNENRGPEGEKAHITVFTTRPDTLYGGTFLVIAPEHLWITLALDEDHHEVLKNRDEVATYVQKAKAKTEIERTGAKEKTGVELKGVKAINPTTGERIPIWVADYAIAHFGTGVLFGDAHDARDFAFAKKYGIPLKPTLSIPGKEDEKIKALETCFEGKGTLFDSGEFSGMTSDEAIPKITEKFGRPKKTYRLRDWLISRQRYWGAPIPIVYDPSGKPHPIPEEHLPWLLPKDADMKPKGTSPLGSSRELKERVEKLFGKGWLPETDTMDGFVDNSWYFLRYLDPKNDAEFSSLTKQKAWMPIRRYSGGAEHTTVHVLYSRFFVKALSDMGLASVSEPYTVRMNRGIILAEDGRKMSKRWGNVVNPDEQVANVGADAVRTYLAFIGPYNEVGSFPWSTNGLIGVRRFLERVAGLSEKISAAGAFQELSILMNQTIKKVGDDIESMKFNTSVSALMIFANELGKLTEVPQEYFETLLKLLSPFAPHLTEELWHELGHQTSIHLESWPSFDASKLTKDTVVVAVQVGGKTRGTVPLFRGAKEEAAIEAVKADPKLAKFLPESLGKVIFVPDIVINIIPPRT